MKNIYQKLTIVDGNRHTSLSQSEGEFLYLFIKDKKIKKTLEIGLAYGVSTAYIMKATNAIHYAIDPFQGSEKYQQIGLKNIRKIGCFSKLKFIPEYSALALPKLKLKNLRFEMVLMDGSHKFDDIFVDFYFIDLLLEKNGYVVIHDIWSPQVKTLLSWIYKNKKNYKQEDIDNTSFVILKKVTNESRKWFEFEKFEVFSDGNVSRYM